MGLSKRDKRKGKIAMTEKKNPVYTDSIENAPKDGDKVVVTHPNTMMYVHAEYDASWGGGRGAWFLDNGTVISPRWWNPAATETLRAAKA